MEFETFFGAIVYRAPVGCKFTQIEFETSSRALQAAGEDACKFTPMEFETFVKTIAKLLPAVQIYSDGV